MRIDLYSTLLSKMAHGGLRKGAGRKPSAYPSKPVNWRVSEYAQDWLKTQAKIQGVSIGRIIDELIASFEEGAREA